MSRGLEPSATAAALQALDDQPPRRIAVFRALFLGDLLCATPALRALRQCFPKAEITLVGLPWAADLVDRLPDLDRFVPFPGYPGLAEVPPDAARSNAFLGEVRANPFDLAVQLHGSGVSSNGFVASLGAPVSIGYCTGADDRLTIALPWVEEEHETRRWLRLTALLGATSAPTRPMFPTTAAERARAASLLATLPGDGPLVGLHPGAKDPARRWPVERFATVGNALADGYDARIVLTGGGAERSLTGALGANLRRPALDLAGETDLGVFAALIDQLDLLVTNDTGASHLAAATGTPSVVLFGPSRPARWAPLDHSRHRAVDALAVTGHADPAAALAALPVAPVLHAARQVLASVETRSVAALSRLAPESLCAG